MGDSEDEYDRKRRDKFRGERTESYSRDGRRDDRRREEWMERESWGRSRGRQGGGDYSGGGGGGGGSSRGGDYMGGGRMGGGRGGDGGGSRYSPPNPHPSSHPRSNPHDHISPPLKRARVSEWEDRRYGGGHDTGYSSYGSAWSHEGSYGSHMGYGGGGGYGGQRGSDMPGMSGSISGGGGVSEVAGGQTQPPMLSFKAYLATQDDNITDEEAIRKYNEYKMEFRRQQLNEFFVAHKEEEWFKIKYHPEDSIKRKDEQMGALKKRVTIFMEFLDSGRLGSVTVDADQSEALVRLLDAVVIRLEGGTAIDLRALENPPENTTHQSHTQGSSSMLASTGSSEGSGGRSGVQDATPSSPIMPSESPSTPGAQAGEKKSEGPAVDKSEESSKPEEIIMKEDNGIDSEKTIESQIPLPSKPKPKGRGKKRKRGYDFESGGSDEDDDDDKDDDDDDMDEDDDGGEEEPVPPGMEDEPPPPGLEGKEDEDDEEEKEEEDEYEDAKRKEAENGDKSEGREDGEEEDEEEEPAAKKETLVEEEPKKEEPKASSDPEQQTPRPLHKTSSIFLRNLAPTITKQEVEAMCKRYPGFLRVAIADPQPERRWFRRGWVTFERSVNIKDICWNLNNIRLRDCELGAIVNRDLSRRIRTVNGVTSHRQVVRHDIKLAARIVHNLDAKCTLWQEDEEDNANGDNSSEKEEKKNKSKKNSGKHKSDSEIPSFGLVSRNPVLKNITDYLIEEASAEEEELLGLSSSNSAATGAAAGSSSSAAGDQEEGQLPADETSVSHPTVERDEALIKVLDRLLLYLRIVHSVDYYNHCEYPNEDEMPNRCGIMHARGSPPSSKVTQQEISDYCRTFEQKIASFLQPTVKLTEDEFVKLGAKDPDSEVEKFIISNTQELSKDKWLCPLSGKKFRGPEFVRKHIFNKHGEKVEEVKKEVEYFNNYLRDPKRPQLPEHPGNRPGRKEAMLGGGGPGDREPYSSQAYMPHYGYGYGGGGGRHFANSYGSGGYGGYGRDSYARGGVDGYARSNPRAYSRSRVVSQSDYSNRPLVAYNDLDMPDEKEFF